MREKETNDACKLRRSNRIWKKSLKGMRQYFLVGEMFTFNSRSYLKNGYFQRRIYVKNKKLTEPFLLFDSFPSSRNSTSPLVSFFFPSFPSLMIFLYDIFWELKFVICFIQIIHTRNMHFFLFFLSTKFFLQKIIKFK